MLVRAEYMKGQFLSHKLINVPDADDLTEAVVQRVAEAMRQTGTAAQIERVIPYEGNARPHFTLGKLITITLPGRVWDDFLDPLASDMQKDIGLPEPIHRKRGRGYQTVYENVSVPMALDLAEYIHGRGDMLLGQGIRDPYDPYEKAQRDVYRAAMRAAEKIQEDVR